MRFSAAGPRRRAETDALRGWPRIEAGVKQFSGGAAVAGGVDGKPFPGQGHSLSGTPVPTEVPPADTNYLKWLLLAAAAAYWFYSARSKANQEAA